jgi:hypothetical protein
MDVQIEQATVDLVLDGDEEYLFEIVGKKYVQLDCGLVVSDFSHSTVFLTGNYIGENILNYSYWHSYIYIIQIRSVRTTRLTAMTLTTTWRKITTFAKSAPM